MDYVDNIFLKKKWDVSVSVDAMSMISRLLSIVGENRLYTVVTMWKIVLNCRKSALSCGIIVILESVVLSVKIDKRHYFQRNVLL